MQVGKCIIRLFGCSVINVKNCSNYSVTNTCMSTWSWVQSAYFYYLQIIRLLCYQKYNLYELTYTVLSMSRIQMVKMEERF